ncbi:MAG: LptE family protein [Ignavibacteria bacterium]|jgi:outer membrane lipopolysaccharide assembly protein LptE/RlpB|nr:LptE family protein [Ignavibacteria bacterium]MCU7504187.1 LptE family protein [Ignavibacteria bacterium]MCU7518112.1 LptE family protein [Ignavibacteria bacterium]
MIYKNMRSIGLLFVIMFVSNFSGCFYSFTGASVAPHLKTVAIPVAEDRSGVGEINLREQFTSKLIQAFNNDNTLRVAEKSGASALLECSIVSFNDAPAVIAASGNNRENVATRRITITVRVLFKDLVKKRTISEKNYSNYGDYTTENIAANRPAGIQTALDRITEDILIGTVSNW